MLVISLVPLALFGYNAIHKTDSAEKEIATLLGKALTDEARKSMDDQARLLAVYTESQLLTYKNGIKTISKHPEIPDMMRAARDTGKITDNTKDPHVPESEGLANFFPADRSGAWQDVQGYFQEIAGERKRDIEMIRIFYKNGYVVNGVQFLEESINDYKGDKSWFREVMDIEKTRPNDYYVSPISVARQTNTSAIRYVAPIDVDGERLGAMIINFKSSAITDELQNFRCGERGFAMLIDANYENAEGKISDHAVVIAMPTKDGSQYHIDEDSPAPIAKEDLIGLSGLLRFDHDGIGHIAAYRRVSWQGKHWYVVVAEPEEDAIAIASTTRARFKGLLGSTVQSLILVLLLSAAFTVTIGYLFAKSITRPINDLAESGKRIADGDRTARIPDVLTGDEVEDLAASMAELAKSAREGKGRRG